MAEAGGGFVTRSFERMLKDAPGKKHTNLQNALKAYLDRKSELPTSKVDQDEDHSHPYAVSQEKVYDEETSAAKEGENKQMQPPPVVSPPKPTTGQAAAAIMAEAGHTLEGSEADIVLLPLRLAFETKQSKLVEPALDCLHKLISYGHLVGEAGLGGGKNGVVTTELFNMVCASSDDEATATDSVRLQVIKVLLTAVASPSFHVHGECLLTAVRTCYNIVLSSKSSVNQATAKATLTQLINIVFKRMETNTEKPDGNVPVMDMERVEDKKVISGNTVELRLSTSSSPQTSSGQVSVEELKQFTGHADIKGRGSWRVLQGFEAALNKVVLQRDLKSGEPMDLESLTVGHRDGVLLLRTICKMAMREETDDLTSRTKILSLELLQGLMESVSDTFTVNYTFIDSVRAYLCYSLLRSCVSPTATIFQLAVNIYMILLQRLRESLKGEIGVFFSLIMLRSLDNADSPPPHRTAVLTMLEKICTDSQVLVDIFVNYDCDLESTNLFEHMISSLSRLAQGTPTADPSANAALYAHQMYISGSSLQCLVSVVQSLEAWTAKEGSSLIAAANPPSIEDEQDSLKRASTEGSELELAKDETKITTQADDFEKAKARKISVEAAVVEALRQWMPDVSLLSVHRSYEISRAHLVFNRKPSDGIKFLVAENLVPHNAKAIAQFLHDTPGLDKKQIGDYLGQHEEFQLAVMHAYVDSMKFVGMKFDHALRMFLNGFRLPGEAQKIDRIMEKFAERYCRDNGNLFKNADTAYVLAYAVIMLNTDAHNPMVWPKMTKADFVHINSSTGADEHAPQELLEEIYDSIVKEEIKLKDEGPTKLKAKPGEKNALLDALNVLNLGGALRRAAEDTKKESEEIVKRTQALFKEKDSKKGVFHRAEHVELARPMLEVGGWHLLPAFSVMMENTDSKSRVLLCLEGFRLTVHLTKTLGMQNLRYAFLTSLIRFTFLHAPSEMRSRNVDALKSLLGLGQTEPESLANAWNAVLKCISTLEYITSTPFFAGPLGPNQVSRDALLLSLTELTGKPTEQVFVNSVKLPSDVIVEFFTALCAVSAEELNHAPPRVFSLTKLVEISYYNMTRIRMVWGRIWAVLSLHFEAAGSYQDEKISMYAIDSLRQLAIKYLERTELANFSFQNDILKPFVVIMRSSKNPNIRALIVECIIQMIKSKVTMIKSGWKSVFMVFTTAAFDDVPWISDAAFENVEQVIMEHFDQVMADSFMDCVNCLFAFANNKSQSSPRTCLKAIAFLRICEDRLAEGQIPGGVSRVVEKGRGRDLEVAEFYWFPILAGLSELTSDPRTEVRNCALEVLFDLLKERGHDFSGPFWDSVFHRVLFPIFEHVRHNGDGEKTESAYQWLRETCIISLRHLCDLFSNFYKEVSFLLPALLGLLLDCATQTDQTLASISMHALVHLTEIGGRQFDAKDWTTLLEHIQSACYKTQPVELLNPMNMLICEPNFPSGYKNSGLITPVASMRGNRSSTPDDDLTTESQKLKLFDEANGSHGELSPISDCSITDAESEGSEGRQSPPSGGLFGSQTHGRRLMVTVMDTILLKNVNFKRGRVVEAPIPTNPPESEDPSDAERDGSEEESPYLQKVRSKCVIQLLLLRAVNSLQRNYWQRLEPSQKLLVMDTLFALVDFASSYNSNFKLRNRMKELSGDRPPPNLLRQEAEGTQVYLAILKLSSMANEADGVALDPSRWKLGPKPRNVVGESQMLREEAERRLVAFYGHVLRESISLQPGPRETVHFDVHECMALRAPVTVKVLMAMSRMEARVFKKHLPEFYPYFIRLICSDQLDVRKALGDLFNLRIMTLLP